MLDCPRCSTPNPDGSRFCNSCGASLVTRIGIQERRVVTALFADLARSTSMGERLDPEIVRQLVGDFFDLARTEIERRGGTVEKFSGDAVMAVFGLPRAHEDDPERAVRAALAIRDGLATTAGQAQQRHGISVQARIGIESGEVVVGDPFGGATMATGDAMNLAARLEQSAEPGDIVVGGAAYDAIRDMVEAESLGQLDLRGHEQAVAGWRVTSVAEDVGRPRGVPGLQAPLTGRDEELNLLIDAARRAQRENKATLFTILGVPGVGKSRLVREAGIRLHEDGWTTIRGRCLPYGDGITYWPAAEIVRTICGIGPETGPQDALARLREQSPEAEVADRLALVIGAAGEQDSTTAGDREIAYGFRRLVEHHASQHGPLLLVFEDIHWAEPPLLDLIEYLVTWARDTPLLVICPSRPELLDRRPAWGSGRMEANRISLEPLTEEESRELLAALLAVDDLPAELRQRVLDRAEGNPLFVEEVVRMLIEEGVVERRGDRWQANSAAASVRVPDSVEALIRARLDTLPTPERAVLQAASVVGRVFQRSAVVAIAPQGGDGGGGQIERHLEDAILRDLIAEERAPEEPTFRFRHILIRDVAYATLPKARRADLHGGVATWLRDWAGARIDEFIEIEAYHLEQAVRLRRELSGSVDDAERDAAIGALERSARLALGRDDMRAARAFAERAVALDPPPGIGRLEIESLLAWVLFRQGESRLAAELGARLEVEAAAAGRKDLQGRAVHIKAGHIWVGQSAADAQTALLELDRAKVLLIEAGDNYHLTFVLELIGYGGWWHGQFEPTWEAWSELRRIAQQNGWHQREAEALILMTRIPLNRNDVEGARRLLDEAREVAARGVSRLVRARIERTYGMLLASTGEPGASPEKANDMAEAALRSAIPVFEEYGDRENATIALVHLGDVERRSSRWRDAVATYERAMPYVVDHAGYRPEVQRRLAQTLARLGEADEAERHALEAMAVTGADDYFSIGSTKVGLAAAREAQGRFDEAEQLLRESIDVVKDTDFNDFDMELAYAEFLLRRGRLDEGQAMAKQARESARAFGPNSPLIDLVDRRVAAALGEAA